MTYRHNDPTRQAEKPATPYITGQEKEITHPGRLSYLANFQTETARNKKTKAACLMASRSIVGWVLRDSNPRPSACKADALNQLS